MSVITNSFYRADKGSKRKRTCQCCGMGAGTKAGKLLVLESTDLSQSTLSYWSATVETVNWNRMERTDLDQWRSREVARLLALVETQRRYYQEIVAAIPVGLLVLSSDLHILLANGAARKIFGLHTGESPRRMDTILPPSLLDRIEEVLKTGVQQTGVMVETGRDKRRLRVGILAIRNWDAEAAQEALLAVEDLTGVEGLLEVATAPISIAEPPAPEASV